MFAVVPLKVLIWLGIILSKLFDDVLANVTVIFLHLRGQSQLILRGYTGRFTALSQKIEYELRDVATGNWNMFNSTSDHIAFRTRNYVSDTITGVNDCAGQCSVCDSVR